VPTNGCSNDINYGIDGTDFMEMNGFGSDAMHGTFSFSQNSKTGDGVFFDGGCQLAGFYGLADFSECAVVMCVLAIVCVITVMLVRRFGQRYLTVKPADAVTLAWLKLQGPARIGKFT
jgi:hypothetical protein